MTGKERQGKRFQMGPDRDQKGHPRAVALSPLLWAGVLAIVFFATLSTVGLLEPDEGRYTEIPREMLATGDYVLPHLNGVLYFEKPPLYYWLNALSIKVFGLNAFASRFWSAALGLAGLWFAYLLGRRLSSNRAGRLAALVLATSPLYLALSRLTIIDMTVSFFMTVTLACFYLVQDGDGGHRSRLLWYGVFASAALAVLAKGLIGIVLPGGIVGLFIIISGRWPVLKRVPWVSGAALFLLIALPWHVLAALRSPDFFSIYIVREHFLRFLTPISDRTEPFWFFVPVLVWALLPWTAFLPGAAADLWSERRRLGGAAWRTDGRLFLWLWAGVIFLFFSASDSKLIPYVLPAVPPLAVLAALRLERILDGRAPSGGWTARFLGLALAAVGVFGAAMLAGGLGLVRAFSASGQIFPLLVASALATLGMAAWSAVLSFRRRTKRLPLALALCAASLFASIWSAAPQIERGRSMRAIASFLSTNLQPGEQVFSYKYYPQTLPVYLRRTIGVVAFEGEQSFGVSKLPEGEREARFPTAQEFRAVWDSPMRVFCVLDRDSEKRMAADGLRPIYPIIQERQVELVTNQPWDSGVGP